MNSTHNTSNGGTDGCLRLHRVQELDMHESKHVLPGQFVHCILLIPLFSILTLQLWPL
jgi:hypothetical protein